MIGSPVPAPYMEDLEVLSLRIVYTGEDKKADIIRKVRSVFWSVVISLMLFSGFDPKVPDYKIVIIC